jgi:DNA segregation ATPase FtsK/SpoIIIE, S-DNA-T family
VIVSRHLEVSQIPRLLDTIKEEVRNFTSREQVLSRDHRDKCLEQIKAFETASTRLSSQLAADVAQAAARSRLENETAASKLQRRLDAVRKGHRTSLKKAHRQIDEFEGRVKYNLQKSVLDAERQLDAGLANADAALEDVKTKLADHRATLDGLLTTAHAAFRGYRKFRRLLAASPEASKAELAGDELQAMGELALLEDSLREKLGRFRRIITARLFGWLSIWLILALLVFGHAAMVVLLPWFELAPMAPQTAATSLCAFVLTVCVAYLYGRQRGVALAAVIARDLARARMLAAAGLHKAQLRHQQTQDRLRRETDDCKRSLDKQWHDAVQQAADMRAQLPAKMEEKARRIALKCEQVHQATTARLEAGYAETTQLLNQQMQARQEQTSAAHRAKMATLNQEHHAQVQRLLTEWNERLKPVWETIQAANAAAAELFPGWQDPSWEQWTPPRVFKNAACFGRIDVDLVRLTEVVPADRQLPLPFPSTFSIPLVLTYPHHGSILFETFKTGFESAVQTMNSTLFRLLSVTPPGKLNLTLVDPVGLGQSFAGLMHLADYAESYINGRIWTQPSQIEERLAELSEHMEKVIQMYLRNEYATIAEYNAQAGVVAEKYHILVIAGFPVNFSEIAGRRLLNIAASGARCGVYTLIHWDHRHALPHEFTPDDLRKHSVVVTATDQGFVLGNRRLPGVDLVLDPAPNPDWATRFLRLVGDSSRDSNRVEVPFEQVAPSEEEIWTKDTTEELTVPIGRTGATKLQCLALGKGTRQHALVVGKTGSGKSTLFHVLVTNLALWCSPDQVEFYLVDFKKGVEFKCYAARKLPHARVVAIESDRHFGLSVLQRIDEELRKRGDLFRAAGAQDLPGYKKAGGTVVMPRCLLIVDEFQEFFVEEDRISQNAAVLLDRIIRQGRAFGIHVLLGSQTLGGAYSLARATLGQMVIRIALQCNEADAYLIMDESNAAPRLLSRPGEGIYNDAAGAIEGNSPFQVVWLPDEVRDTQLAKIRARADRLSLNETGPVVFEGNSPAQVTENALLRAALENRTPQFTPAPRIWLGTPNSIKGPTEAVFHRQNARNLLMVGAREESALAILAVALFALAAQIPKKWARFVLFDSSSPGSPKRGFLTSVIQHLPHPVLCPTQAELANVLSELAAGLKQNQDHQTELTTFVIIHGLENFKKLKQEDEFSLLTGGSEGANPASRLLELITEGPSRGLHVLITCDSYNNVIRFLGRKALEEFALRVLFQMSASDSASLIDSPEAGNLGLFRALFYNEQEGFSETFRPYALPGSDWLRHAARLLVKE